MDETPCTNKDIDSPVSAVLDHRKRKKDEDMTEDQDIPRAKLHLTWTQGEQDVLMTTKLGAGDGEADKVEVTFAEQQMTIKLSDGREHCWCFHGAIDKDQSRVQRKKGKFTIKVVKKEAGLWPSLEAVEKPAVQEGNVEHMSSDNEMMDSSQEVRRKEEEPIMDLHHIKHDFFERDDSLTVHIYVKNVSKDAVKVHFDKQSFMVKFQTSDVKFLQLHEGASEDTVFCWKVSTKKAICPAACKHKFTPSFIELTLKKVSAERWGMLEALQRKEMASSSKSASWIAAKSGSSGAVTTGGDSGSVAFDEMTPVDINRRDSDSADISTAAQTGSNSFRNQKPTAKVQPLNKQAMEMSVITPGYTGLDNLGNTCFMNSVIQVLANTCEFRDYFLNGLFQRELNRDNVLGTGGQLAVAFAVLLRVLWGGTCHTCAPSKLKELVSRKANQFMGFQQHDAQEFLAFLLDGLHEDVNRVKAKPYTEAVEDDGRPDHVVADEAWEMYKRRNDSFVVDLLQGQYKSKLVCPICKKVSITFDPFLYLSVPLPKRKKTITVNFMWRDPIRKPVKFLVQLVKDSSVQHLKEILSRKTHVLPNNMRVFEVHRSLFHKHFVNGNDLSGVQPNDLIIVSEVLSAETAGEEVVEVEVIQRTLTAHQYPTRCSSCHKECKSGEKLRRCTKCLKTGYCDQTCQRSHWQIHRNQCNTAPEPVGCPFILSLPRSHCTYSCIARLMESFARYSVDTFQPPVKAEPITPTIITTTTTTSPVTNLMLPPSGDLQLPSHTSASNLSSSSGSQSSGSLSSLDSISSCSSTATLTAETSQATFDISHSGEEEDDKEQEEKGKELSLDDGGYGDITSDLGSSVSSQGSAACPMSSFGATDGESGREKFSKDCLASPSTSQGAEKMGTGVTVQSVAANRHTERSVPLFFIKPVTAEGRGIRELDRLDDKGTSPLDMSAYRCLSMDWRNSEKLASYVLVQSKPLETDLDESVLCGSQYESDTITLHQCLELFTEPEILAPNEAWYCPRCKAEREASKQMSIWRLPHTLIIQLKRFSFRNALWRDKIDKMVEFPIRGLDMSPFAAGAHRPGDPQPIYDLYGVVNHHGGILGGHYTSFARCAHPTIPLKNEVGWRLFDDSRVTSISNEKNVVTRAAYLLFYRRRQPFVPSVSPAQLPLTAPAAAEQERAKESNEDGMASNNEDLGGSAEMVGSLADNFEEKHDMEKDEDDNEECSGDSGMLVIDMDDPMPALGYTDMDAVD